MASPLDEAVNGFVNDVFSNGTLSNDDRKQLVLAAMQSLQNKIEDGTHRWGASLRLTDLGKDARQLRRNKFANESRKGEVEEYDDHYSGC
jgi:hypothetical protein